LLNSFYTLSPSAVDHFEDALANQITLQPLQLPPYYYWQFTGLFHLIDEAATISKHAFETYPFMLVST